MDTHTCDAASDAASDAMVFLSRRWMSAVLLAAGRGAVRFGTYRRMVAGISDRMLSVRLKELVSHGLIRREVVPTMPVQVLYHLTERGRSLLDAATSMARWAYGNTGEAGTH
ncbi:winged helix-turn-helix transcriptional regulator [Amycolatopsis sp. cmx-4-68]|uniref:winged helix-turn-helix transcriptional regulator n=1 Tax=Amycolatopsis sp. cmx-4-68 TaxID=2790938 RepID=UPI003978D98D